MSLNKLRDEVHQIAIDHGWWEGEEHNIPERLALIHSEVSEALEDFRSSELPLSHVMYDQGYGYSSSPPGKPVGFAVELADALIRIADLCGHLGIDLDEAVRTKVEFNKGRPYRHGNKRA